jgi:hypothetical protein
MTDVNPTTLDELWSEIGFSEDEKASKLQELRSEIDGIHGNFIEEAEQLCVTLTSTIEQVKESHISKLKVIDAPESEIERVEQSGVVGDIRTRQREVQSQFDDFYITVYQPRAAEFSHLQAQIRHSSDRLGLELEPEFAEIGTEDLSLMRLAKFRSRSRDLDQKLTAEIIRFAELEEEISNLSRDLQEDNPPAIQEILQQQNYSERVFEQLTEHRDELKQLFDKRRRYISEMAVEITKLWDLLNVEEYVRNQFMASHTVLSQKNVEDCIAEAERLIALRNTQLPHLIELMKTDIEHIASDLSYTKAELLAIFKACAEAEDDKQLFDNYEAQLIRLKKLHIAATPILDLVRQREEIIQEYKKLERAEAPEQKPYRPKSPGVAEKSRIERIRRRHKVVLPRVEGKLMVLLEKFRDQGAMDFTWKGQTLIDELKDVAVPDSTCVRKTSGTSAVPSKRSRNSVAPTAWAVSGGSSRQRKSVGPKH